MRKLLHVIAFALFLCGQAQAQNVGVGTTAPASKLSVNGNLSVGSSYTATAAPSNGAIVQGYVGIGTPSPVNALHIRDFDAAGPTSHGEGLQITNNAVGATVTDGVALNLHSTNGNARLWNYENASLIFGTDNTERLRINQNGNVIISTPTSGEALVVNGKSKFSDLQLTTGAVNGYVLKSDATGNATWANPATIGADVTTASNGLTEVGNDVRLGGTLSAATTVTQAGYDMIFTGGNVGIGTTPTVSRLQIGNGILTGDNGGYFATRWSSDAHHGIWYRASVSADGSTVTAGDAMTYREYGTATSGHHFWTGGATQTEKFRITNNYTSFPINNVGIGTTNPLIKVDMNVGQVIGTTATTNSQHDVANRETKVSFGASVAQNLSEFAGMRVVTAAGTAGCGNTSDIRFDTWECNTSVSREVMRINGTGNVGIGTASPAARLHVNGSVKLGSSGTVIRNIQGGQVTIGSSGSATKEVTLTFPNAFNTTPRVIATCQTETGQTYTDNFSVTVRTVSATSCVLTIRRTDNNSGWGQNLLCNWMAFDL